MNRVFVSEEEVWEIQALGSRWELEMRAGCLWRTVNSPVMLEESWEDRFGWECEGPWMSESGIWPLFYGQWGAIETFWSRENGILGR